MSRTALLVADDRTATRPRRHLTTTALQVAGAVALAWTAGIHLRLWTEGYSHIPTIGPLFMMQSVIGSALSLVVLALALPPVVAPKRPPSKRAELVAAAVSAGSALFLVSTIGGLLLSDWVGLFGLHDHMNSPYAGLSLTVEGIGAAVLLAAAVARARPYIVSVAPPTSGAAGDEDNGSPN